MATLHRLGKPNIEQLEQDLLEFSSQAPIALVLPCHVKELGTSALRGIIKELKNIQYVRQIVVGIDGANATNWQRAKRIFSQLPQKPILIWNDGPRMRRLIEQLIESDLDPGPSGKGRNLWLCFGYVLASDKSRMVALHDCDIVTYSREYVFRYRSPMHLVEVLRSYYGPMHKAFGALDADKQAALTDGLIALMTRFNRSGDASLVLPSEYLEVVVTKA